MSDSDCYKVMKNDETGAEIYQCNACSSKYGTKKAIKTHVTSKHKPKKKTEDKIEEKNDPTSPESEFVFDDKEGSGKDPGKTGDAPHNPSVEPIATEDIALFYEGGNSEFLDDVEYTDLDRMTTTPQSTDPKVTIDETIIEQEEVIVYEGEPTLKEDLFTENMLLKSRISSHENTAKEMEQKIVDIETNLIDANTEVSKLNDEKRATEEENRVKDEQNEILVGEKNKLEENVSRFDAIMQKMFKERTAMKKIIDNQKNTIEQMKEKAENISTEVSGDEAAKKLSEIKLIITRKNLYKIVFLY